MQGSLHGTVNRGRICIIAIVLLVAASFGTVVLADNTLAVNGVAGCEQAGSIMGTSEVTVNCTSADFTISVDTTETIAQIDLFDAPPTAGCAASGGSNLIETICTAPNCFNGSPINVTSLSTEELLALFDLDHSLRVTTIDGDTWALIDNSAASKDPPNCLAPAVPALNLVGVIALVVLILIGGGWILLRR